MMNETLIVPCEPSDIAAKIAAMSNEEKTDFIRKATTVIRDDSKDILSTEETQQRARLVLMMEEIIGVQFESERDFRYKVDNFLTEEHVTIKGRKTKRTSRGGEIRKIRRKLGLSQLNLAFRLEIQKRQLAQYESGKIRPSKKIWMRLNDMLEKKKNDKNTQKEDF